MNKDSLESLHLLLTVSGVIDREIGDVTLNLDAAKWAIFEALGTGLARSVTTRVENLKLGDIALFITNAAFSICLRHVAQSSICL